MPSVHRCHLLQLLIGLILTFTLLLRESTAQVIDGATQELLQATEEHINAGSWDAQNNALNQIKEIRNECKNPDFLNQAQRLQNEAAIYEKNARNRIKWEDYPNIWDDQVFRVTRVLADGAGVLSVVGAGGIPASPGYFYFVGRGIGVAFAYSLHKDVAAAYNPLAQQTREFNIDVAKLRASMSYKSPKEIRDDLEIRYLKRIDTIYKNAENIRDQILKDMEDNPTRLFGIGPSIRFIDYRNSMVAQATKATEDVWGWHQYLKARTSIILQFELLQECVRRQNETNSPAPPPLLIEENTKPSGSTPAKKGHE